ncbi:MAG: serine hydrolase, partial [Bacteroidota bacterium]
MKQLLLRTLLLWAACWVGLQAIHAQADYEALDRYIEQAVTDFKLPGLAVGIVKDDKVVFVKGYGVD